MPRPVCHRSAAHAKDTLPGKFDLAWEKKETYNLLEICHETCQRITIIAFRSLCLIMPIAIVQCAKDHAPHSPLSCVSLVPGRLHSRKSLLGD